MPPDKIPSPSTKRMRAGKLRVMRVASYCCTFFFDLLFMQSRNFITSLGCRLIDLKIHIR